MPRINVTFPSLMEDNRITKEKREQLVQISRFLIDLLLQESLWDPPVVWTH